MDYKSMIGRGNTVTFISKRSWKQALNGFQQFDILPAFSANPSQYP